MLAPFGIRPKGTLLARMLPLAQALTRRGHSVAIIAPPVQNPEDAGTRVVYNGVPVIHTALPHLTDPFTTFTHSAAMLRRALAERPTLLHLFKPKGYSGLAALAARIVRPRLPLVVDTDDWEGAGGWNTLRTYPASAKALFAWQERDLPRRAQAVTVASRTLESLVWSLGIAPQRVIYLPNGATLPKLRLITPTTPTLLLYTRFWELDLTELSAALAAIHTARPKARLIVVGHGENDEEDTLRALAARAGFAPMLDYRGWLAPAAIPATLAAAQVALVPARDTLINRARCSAKLLELMGAGLAVLASDVGEARTFIQSEHSGLLVPPGDPGAFAAAVLRLLDDQPLRERLGAEARVAAARFSWDALAPLAEDAYRVALGGQDA